MEGWMRVCRCLATLNLAQGGLTPGLTPRFTI